MSNLLFGSSNVYRHFKRGVHNGLFLAPSLQLVKCTKKAVFDAHVVSMTSLDLLVSSVLANFIVDACEGVPDNEAALFANQQVTAHVQSLLELSVRFPSANFIIVPPFYRSTPAWFGSHLPGVLSHLTSEVTKLSSSRIAVISPFVVVPSLLEADGIHLHAAGGDQLLRHIDAQIRGLLVPVVQAGPSSSSDDRLDLILAAVTRNSDRLESFGTLSSTVATLVASTKAFETSVRIRHQNDNFIFARMKEESDTDVNRSREDRACITGLPIPPPQVTGHKEKKEHYMGVVTRLVSIACASLPDLPRVVDLYLNLRAAAGQHLVEVRFDSKSGASAFRREGVSLAKAHHPEFSELFFTNSVTQSTRVRIEILRILATKLTTVTEFAFVQGFVSRPVLHYRVRPGAQSTAEGIG